MARPTKTDPMTELRQALVVALEKRSLRDIGEAADVPHTTLADFVKERKGIKLDQADRVGKVLGMWLRWDKLLG